MTAVEESIIFTTCREIYDTCSKVDSSVRDLRNLESFISTLEESFSGVRENLRRNSYEEEKVIPDLLQVEDKQGDDHLD